ncbi:MAG: MFS transporter [Verrucomicrobiota bacterium JB022]|nr:MFS transporter [Verrucomicrobiota bacterium JB022]
MSLFRRLWHPRVPFSPAGLPFFYGWVVLVVAGLGIIGSIPGQTVGVGVFSDALCEALNISRLQLSYAYMGGTALSGFLLPLGGQMLDRLGARRFFVLAAVLFGLSLAAISQLDWIRSSLLGWLSADWQLGGLQVNLGSFVATMGAFLLIRFSGQGLLTLAPRAMLMKWWNRRRGLVTAIQGVMVSGVFASAPALLLPLVNGLGWSGAYLVLAGLALFGLGAMGWLFYRDNPEECGLVMDGKVYPAEKAEPKNPDLIMRKEFTRGEAMRTYAFWLFTLMMAFQGLFFTAISFHLVDLGESLGVGGEGLSHLFGITGLVTIATNLLVGFLLDHIRLRYVSMAMCLGGMICSGGLLLMPGSLGQGLFVLGLGMAWGCFPSITGVTYARFFGRQHLGAISGMAMSWLVWGSAFGPAGYGQLKALQGSYRGALAMTLCMYGVFLVGSWFAVNPQRKVPVA